MTLVNTSMLVETVLGRKLSDVEFGYVQVIVNNDGGFDRVAKTFSISAETVVERMKSVAGHADSPAVVRALVGRELTDHEVTLLGMTPKNESKWDTIFDLLGISLEDAARRVLSVRAYLASPDNSAAALKALYEDVEIRVKRAGWGS